MYNFEPEFYKALMESLDNNSVLRKRNENGIFVPIRCSREFAEMMECEPEQFLRVETEEPLSTIVPEDRDKGAFLLNNKIADDGANHTILRKRTMKGNIIWVDLHYAFFNYDGGQYAYCNYFDVTALKENEAQIQSAYNSIKDELHAIALESLVTLRANLMTDTIEEISGRDVYDTDKDNRSFSALLRDRLNYFPLETDRKKFQETFNPLSLIAKYNLGQTSISEVLFSKRASGRTCFVNYTVTLRMDPETGNIMVFATEVEYNSEKVSETMNEKILAKQYDMITYITDGQYGVVIGDAKNIKEGSIFPKEKTGSYMDYINNEVMPFVYEEEVDKEELLKKLMPETIDREIKVNEPYSVSVVCKIDGGVYYKRFDFYAVDLESKFYILLKSDYTRLQKEQSAMNEQLREALKEAEQASVAKTAFLSRMSHEIRTPMNAIIGLDTIALQEENLSEDLKDNLNKIGSSARYLLSLINDILDMSRIESGRMVIKNEEFEFHHFLEDINTIIYSQCQDKGLNYDCFIHGKVDERYIADSNKLKQVLINILGNAVKFTNAPGNVSLSVECLTKKDKHSKFRFVVKDTGIGMDADYLPKIFDAFSQEDGSNTNKYGGSGLGMAITKNIVEMMNGTIKVDSVKGEGSTFTIEVVFRDSELGSDTKLQDVSIKPEDMRILVIDDDPIACQHAKIVLEESGYASETCMTKQEAVDFVNLYHARREDFNLILVDLRMPEYDGIDVTRAIREIIGKEAAIIILTAYNWSEVEEEAIDAGVDGFMRKPLYGENVIREFYAAFRRRQLNYEKTKREVNIEDKKILLAEDVDINAKIMQRLLKMKGAEAEHAENGKRAYEIFVEKGENYFDAVLMDIRMPEWDGLKATEEIRALDTDYAKKIPIVAMTANAFDEDVQRSLQAGMDAHLSKPVEPEKLYETLDSLINEGGGIGHGRLC